MKDNTNYAKIIGALLLGAAVGGALGVLFAPEKGSDTRKKILSKGDDLTDSLKEKLNGFMEDVKKEIDTVKSNAKDLIEKGSAKVESSKDR
ncbi:MAG: YtxH domain-containing protein [bacterium]|nr:YtxH domain-containing protein [bacterium]